MLNSSIVVTSLLSIAIIFSLDTGFVVGSGPRIPDSYAALSLIMLRMTIPSFHGLGAMMMMLSMSSIMSVATFQFLRSGGIAFIVVIVVLLLLCGVFLMFGLKLVT